MLSYIFAHLEVRIAAAIPTSRWAKMKRHSCFLWLITYFLRNRIPTTPLPLRPPGNSMQLQKLIRIVISYFIRQTIIWINQLEDLWGTECFFAAQDSVRWWCSSRQILLQSVERPGVCSAVYEIFLVSFNDLKLLNETRSKCFANIYIHYKTNCNYTFHP